MCGASEVVTRSCVWSTLGNNRHLGLELCVMLPVCDVALRKRKCRSVDLHSDEARPLRTRPSPKPERPSSLFISPSLLEDDHKWLELHAGESFCFSAAGNRQQSELKFHHSESLTEEDQRTSRQHVSLKCFSIHSSFFFLCIWVPSDKSYLCYCSARYWTCWIP